MFSISVENYFVKIYRKNGVKYVNTQNMYLFSEWHHQMMDTHCDVMLLSVDRYLDFEDDQNEKLMQALDLATKGQLSETDRYIGAEVDLIKEAIGDEEMLQVCRPTANTPTIPHSFTHSLARSPARQPARPPTHPLTHPLTHPPDIISLASFTVFYIPFYCVSIQNWTQ